jgi:integrase
VKRHEKADLIGDILDDLYPNPPIPLDHRDPYTLLVAVALSAQTTDKKVNQITPALFAEAATPAEMVELGPERILELIRELGLAPTKAKNLWLAATQILDAGGEVIADWAFLESLAGVGHKTAIKLPQLAIGGFDPQQQRIRHPTPRTLHRETLLDHFRDQKIAPIEKLAIPFRAPTSPSCNQARHDRVIADDVWAKLMWAGLNLEHSDVYANPVGRKHPIELLRALALTWLFGGLRSDEIVRLRVGCVRWQREHVALPRDTGETLDKDAVCLLDVPVHKTGTAFTKPVDPILGQAIAAWEAVRPTQPAVLDRKTSERAHLLFSYRAQGIGREYLNIRVIPALCTKAGVPSADVRGNITSHRARSTIASQLYNAKEPMTLFELQAWLGHRSPSATQQYAKIAPTTLAKAYSDAGYFARNVRTIEVLVDRDAVASGAAATGEPWQYYDLGHGYCTYSFFEQCPHRMACARCDFYTPKDSSKAQLLEAKDNLQRMR